MRLSSAEERGTQVEGLQGRQVIQVEDAGDPVPTQLEPFQLREGLQSRNEFQLVVGLVSAKIHKSSRSRTGKHSRFSGSSSSQRSSFEINTEGEFLDYFEGHPGIN